MVSRRKILSRSRDDLNLDTEDYKEHAAHHQDDTWYSKEKLYKDHVEEILRKWDSIDDEIWAKVIVLERNRRVAKAYARAPVLTINGGNGGFDGYRLGLNGFSNPMRDPKTEEFKEMIGQGAKVKMDESGNILLKRLSSSQVFVKNSPEESSVSNDVMKLPQGLVDIEKPFRVFDMRKFQQNVNRELRRTNPDRLRLESQCVTAISFVKNEPELLDSPIWILIINIVALEMLKAKLPQASRVPLHQMQNMSLDPKRRFALSGSSDEDPYSLTSGNGSSGSSARFKQTAQQLLLGPDKTPLLNKKERDFFVPQNWSATQDRKRDRSRDNFLDDEPEISTLKPRTNNRRRILKKTDEKKNIADDPYYCGFSARVPNFVKQGKQKQAASSAAAADKPAPHHQQQQLQQHGGGAHQSRDRDGGRSGGPKYRETSVLPPPAPAQGGAGAVGVSPALAHIPQVQPFWWHSRLYPSQDTVGAGMKGPSTSSFQASYFDRHLPFTYTPQLSQHQHTPNEFSSFQFSGAGVGGNLGSQTPLAGQKNKTNKKKGFKQNLYKSGANF